MNPERKSGWTTFLQVTSTLCLIIGVLSFVGTIMSNGKEREELFFVSIICSASGLNGFLIAFLVQTFVECRNYLKRIDSKLKGSNEMYSVPNLYEYDSNPAVLLVAFLVATIVVVLIIKFK